METFSMINRIKKVKSEIRSRSEFTKKWSWNANDECDVNFHLNENWKADHIVLCHPTKVRYGEIASVIQKSCFTNISKHRLTSEKKQSHIFIALIRLLEFFYENNKKGDNNRFLSKSVWSHKTSCLVSFVCVFLSTAVFWMRCHRRLLGGGLACSRSHDVGAL